MKNKHRYGDTRVSYVDYLQVYRHGVVAQLGPENQAFVRFCFHYKICVYLFNDFVALGLVLYIPIWLWHADLANLWTIFYINKNQIFKSTSP